MINQYNIISTLHSRYKTELDNVNSEILKHLISDEDIVQDVGKYLVMGNGKRVRPLLTILCARMFGNNDNKPIYLAAAIEFIHAATLLHDDVVDNSSCRRYKPTANLIWGNKEAILVGDFLFSQSFKLMIYTESIEALRSLARASATIAEGEVKQLVNIKTNKWVDAENYNQVISAKTAELFAAAAEVGGIIANRTTSEINKIYNYAKKLGEIFQIRDDWLDYFSNLDELGKNVGDDFNEGKITLPIILLHQTLDIESKRILEDTFLKKSEELKKFEFSETIELMNNLDVGSKVDAVIDKKSKEALAFLDALDIDDEYKVLLSDLLIFAAKRAS